MKIKNFEAFAKRVARKLDTTIVRVSSDAIWFANYYYINFDGEFIYIADYSKDTPRKVMCAFIYTYNTQKDFFNDLEMMMAIKEAAETSEIEEIEEHNEYEEILDHKESTDRDRINHLMETHSFPSISEMYNDKCFCCPADRKGNECKGTETCGKTWKRYEAITNPEWHHVSLSTLVNLDFDMLDEKRQLYLSLYREIKELINDLHKCKSGRTYENRLAKMYSRNAELVYENKVTSDFIRYVTKKVSMCNVECGLWNSANEESTGYHKSRIYNHSTMRY